MGQITDIRPHFFDHRYHPVYSRQQLLLKTQLQQLSRYHHTSFQSLICEIAACRSHGAKEILVFFVPLFQGSRTSNICLWKEYRVHMKLLYLDCEAQNLRKSPVYCGLYFATNEIRRPSYAKIPLHNFDICEHLL